MSPDLDTTQDGTTGPRLSLARQFTSFLWENKVWWITPTVLILVFLAVIVYLTNGHSIAPFFYSIF